MPRLRKSSNSNIGGIIKCVGGKQIWQLVIYGGTEKEKELTELVKNGATVKELANHFHRTTTAIEIKVNRLE